MQLGAVLLETYLVIAIVARFNDAAALMGCSRSRTDSYDFLLASRDLLSDLPNKT